MTGSQGFEQIMDRLFGSDTKKESNESTMNTKSVNFWKDVDSLAKIEESPGERFSSGFSALDQIFTSMGSSGLKSGIYLLVGDPGSGKSSFALQVMHRMIENGHKGAYLAYEGKINIYECIRRLHLTEIVPVVDQDDGWMPTSQSVCEMLIAGFKHNKTGKPAVYCIDSVKNLNSAEGSIKGRRTAIKQLMTTVAETNSIVFLIGHVSKETRGKTVKRIQGPSELEELCDVRMDFINLADSKSKKKKAASKPLEDCMALFLAPFEKDTAKFAKLIQAGTTIGKAILTGALPRDQVLQVPGIEANLLEAIQKATVYYAYHTGGSVRHMMIDTSVKNRLGRPDEYWQFYLTEGGWFFPKEAILYGRQEENVFWINGIHTSQLAALRASLSPETSTESAEANNVRDINSARKL